MGWSVNSSVSVQYSTISRYGMPLFICFFLSTPPLACFTSVALYLCIGVHCFQFMCLFRSWRSSRHLWRGSQLLMWLLMDWMWQIPTRTNRSCQRWWENTWTDVCANSDINKVQVKYCTVSTSLTMQILNHLCKCRHTVLQSRFEWFLPTCMSIRLRGFFSAGCTMTNPAVCLSRCV